MGEPIHVFRNRKSKDFLVQKYSGIYATGKFVQILAIQMQENGLGMILRLISDKSPPKTGEVPELKAYTNEERRAFFRQHPSVSVAVEGNTLSIGPFHRQGSGFVVPKNEILKISLPSTNQEFLLALNRAFESAE